VPGARLLFTLDPSVAHLDNGSYGATRSPAHQQRLRDEVNANPCRVLGPALADRVAHTRRHLATFIGADPDGCAFVPSVDLGIAMVLRSLTLESSDEIVTLDTCRAAVAAAVGSICVQTGARHRIVGAPAWPQPGTALVAAVTASLTARTRLVVIDHVTASTARLQPVDQVVAVARHAGAAVLVDGTATAGSIAVAVSQLGADFWVGDLHTWAFAPRQPR
jgi:isopenicillin-N epimerase